MSAGFDPLYKWLGIPPNEQPPHCYRLLGLEIFEENPDVIENAADRQMAYLRTFQTGPNIRLAQEVLNQVAVAKSWLLNPQKKAQYDAWLREQLAASVPSPPPVAASARPVPEPGPDLSEMLSDTDPYLPSRGRIKKRRRRQWIGVAISLVAAVLAVGIFGVVAVNLRDGSPDKGEPDSDPTVGTAWPKAGAKEEGTKAEPSREKRDGTTKKSGPAKDASEQFSVAKKNQPDARTKDASRESKKGEGDEKAAVEALDFPKTLDRAERLQVPGEAAREKAAQMVREVYKSQFAAAVRVADKQALAKRLLQEAIQTENDPAGQFALFETVEKLAVESGDGLTAFSAVEELSQRYRVDALDQKSRILETFAKKARSPEEHRSVADEALRVADAAMAEGRMPAAVQLGKLATGAATKSRDKETLQRTRTRAKELEEITAAYEDVKAASATLAEKPDDPQANLVLGKYQCFLRGDWETGLPMLAKGGDAGLKALARRDLEGASVPEAQVALADEWRLLAGKSSGLAKRQLQSRAAHWYRKAIPGLSGLAKAAAERWLKELEEAPK